MLFDLVERVCTQIEELDSRAELPRMQRQIQQYRPDSVDGLFAGRGSNLDRDTRAAILASTALALVKSVPAMARTLVAETRNERHSAARRCAVASVLCYLVQPRDLVPDIAPAGYGLIDDAAFVRAGMVEYLQIIPDEPAASTEEQAIEYFALLLPHGAVPELRDAISTLSVTFQLFSMFDDANAQYTLSELLNNPLEMEAPLPPPTFLPRTLPQYGDSRVWTGFTVDADALVGPGGIRYDGSVFIVS